MIKHGTQKGIILNFLQKHPDLKVRGCDFMRGGKFPFVGQCPSSRLVELCSLGLASVVGTQKNSLLFAGKRGREMNLYQITKSGMMYKLGGDEPQKTILDYFKELYGKIL